MAGNRLANGLPSGVNQYFNTYKNSLFAEVEKQKFPYKKFFIHRLVYIAKLNSDEHTIAGHYEQFVAKIQKNNQPEGITGLLLIYPEYIVHLIETSSEILALLLKDLCDVEQRGNPLLKDTRVLVVSHCLFSRMFTSWAPQILTMTLSLQDSETQIEPEELLAQIYKLCISIQKTKDCKSEMLEERAVLMVEEAVRHMCQSAVLRSPSEFLQVYGKPINILMDSGWSTMMGTSPGLGDISSKTVDISSWNFKNLT
ncbi:testis-expressed protein 47-like isoform X1 [Alosa alosa]|uniref:testis-expressed protein 47-like isoform X1 n=1 Tax=Alosa alosa TaxID=278164 RepID=UPI0020152BB2|nr:testis-expressed protein 47-like isoform X1 [Alosa alosa]